MMDSFNYFDILVFVIFSFVSYSLYRTLRSNNSDAFVPSSKFSESVKRSYTVSPSLNGTKNVKDKRNICPLDSNFDGFEELKLKLFHLMKIDKTFDAQTFLIDSKVIFDTLFRAFYKKDLSLMDKITTPAVFNRLKSSIETFNKNNENFDAEIVNFKSVIIHDILFPETSKKQPSSLVSVILDFHTDQSIVVLDNDKKVLRGDDNLIVSMKDRFVFSRDLSKKNSVWLLSDILAVPQS